MADDLDLAGVIGTWVAAFLALVALVGIVGPILVWRASRTETQQALAKVDAGMAESAGFVGKGIQVWPGIRLFRRVRAPMLQHEPVLENFTMSWNENTRVSKASASWVKLGIAMRCLHLDYAVGNSLDIISSQALLPANKIWLLTVGLMGRFGTRKDDGKLLQARRTGIISTQAVPGSSLDLSPARSNDGNEWDSIRHYGDDRIDGGERRYRRIKGCVYQQISGVFGTLFIETSRATDVANTHFEAHSQAETGQLDADRLPVDDLFWLAVGCIPSADGKVFGLENVHFIADLYDQDQDPAILSPPGRNGGYVSSPSAPDMDYNERRSRHPHAPYYQQQTDFTLATYVPATSMSRQKPSRSSWGVRAFKFSPTYDRVGTWQGAAKALGVEKQNRTVLSLEEIALTREQRDDLEYFSSITYPPSDCNWVRLTEASNSASASESKSESESESPLGSAWFLPRSEAQILAKSLLELPICRKGYLFHRSQTSKCRELLYCAESMLPRLLNNIIHNINDIDLDESLKPIALTAMRKLQFRLQRSEYTRYFATAIYELDEILERVLLPTDGKIKHGIGVLVLCHEEIRHLITLAVRRITHSLSGSVQIDLESPALVMTAVLGSEQRFPIDMQALFPEFRHEQQRLDVTFTTLLLVTLKACLRSSFLKTSLDSLPLMECIAEMEDIIRVG